VRKEQRQERAGTGLAWRAVEEATLLAALLLSSLSFAADLQPAAILPGAAPAEAGSASVSVGVGGYAAVFVGAGTYGSTHISWAPSDQVQLSFDAFQALSRQQFEGVAALGSVRVLAVDTERFRLAPTLSMGGIPVGWSMAPGLAMEGGGEVIRWDASVSLLTFGVGGGQAYVGPLYSGLAASEAGLSCLLGDHNRVRVGMVSALPSVSWKHTRKHWHLDMTVASLLVVNMVQLRTGVRF
jgi:hypothetical protein